MVDIRVPSVGESISEVTLVKWLKNNGDYVDRDEVIAELESEKATFEVNAEKAGTLKTIGKEGDTIKIGDVVAQIDETAAKPEKSKAEAGSPKSEVKRAPSSNGSDVKKEVAPEKTIQKSSEDAAVKATPVAAAIISDKKVA